VGGTPGYGRLREGLVVLEVALCTMLVAGVGFLALTLAGLVRVERGVRDPARVLAVPLSPLPGPAAPAALPAFYRRLEGALRAQPGVGEVAFATHSPEKLEGFRVPVRVEGAPAGGDVEGARAHVRIVTASYFATLGTPVLAGRLPGAPRAGERTRGVVVNAAFAQRLLERSPRAAVGTRVALPDFGVSGEVSAVVADVVFDATARTPPMVFLPDPSLAAGGMVLLVRTGAEPASLLPSIRRAVWSVDPALPLNELRSLESVVAAGLDGRRAQLLLVGVFAALALALGAVGIYGLMDENVARRAREIGLRQALGADRGELARMILSRALRLVAAGTLLGLLGAFLVHGLLASLLYGVRPVEPRLLAGVVAVLATVALAASVVPIRRAARVDPAVALRAE
jgi:predicted permease